MSILDDEGFSMLGSTSMYLLRPLAKMVLVLTAGGGVTSSVSNCARRNSSHKLLNLADITVLQATKLWFGERVIDEK